MAKGAKKGMSALRAGATVTNEAMENLLKKRPDVAGSPKEASKKKANPRSEEADMRIMKKKADGDPEEAMGALEKKVDVDRLDCMQKKADQNLEKKVDLGCMQKKVHEEEDPKAVRKASISPTAKAGPLAAYPLGETNILEAVALDSAEATEPGSHLWGLLEETRDLADEIFHEDLLERIRESYGGKHPWRLVLLARKKTPEEAAAVPTGEGSGAALADKALLGFMVMNLWGRPSRTLGILRVAVPSRFRGEGYGTRLMQFAMSYARKLPREECGAICCSSLEESVPFYRHLGFQNDTSAALQELENSSPEREGLVPGQVWMKYKLGRPAPKSKTAKKR